MSKDEEWTSAKHEEIFEKFEDKMEEFKPTGKKLQDKHVNEMLDFLMTFKTQILELPISTKVSDFTVQRFYLFFMPLIGLLHPLNKHQAEDQMKSFMELLMNSDYPLNCKFGA